MNVRFRLTMCATVFGVMACSFTPNQIAHDALTYSVISEAQIKALGLGLWEPMRAQTSDFEALNYGGAYYLALALANAGNPSEAEQKAEILMQKKNKYAIYSGLLYFAWIGKYQVVGERFPTQKACYIDRALQEEMNELLRRGPRDCKGDTVYALYISGYAGDAALVPVVARWLSSDVPLYVYEACTALSRMRERRLSGSELSKYYVLFEARCGKSPGKRGGEIGEIGTGNRDRPRLTQSILTELRSPS